MRLIAKLSYASVQVYGVSLEQWNQRVSPSISLLGGDSYVGRVDLIPKTATEYVSIRPITCCASDSLKTAGIFFSISKTFSFSCATELGSLRFIWINETFHIQWPCSETSRSLSTDDLFVGNLVGHHRLQCYIRPTPSSDGSAVVNW